MPTVTRSFTTDELALIGRGFARGTPNAATMALPGFLFGADCHAASVTRLGETRPGEPMIWPAAQWDCLGVCCLVGAGLLDGISEAEHDLLSSLLSAEPDAGPIGFH